MSNEALQQAAEGIEDEALRNNALALLAKMTEVIEGIGDRDISWRPSSLKVVQAMTDTDNLPDGAKAGSMVVGDSLLSKDYNVIPLRSWTSRTMWNPDLDVNETVCQSPDGKVGYKYGDCYSCPNAVFGESGSPCNKQINVMVVSADLSDVFVCNFYKSQFAMGKDWQNNMKRMKVLPYKRVYKLNTGKHPKYSNVKALSAHVQTDEIPADVVSFLEALFSKVKEDRAAYLDAFYANLQSRQEKALENKSGDDFEQAGLEVKEGEVVEGADDDSKQYKI